MKIAKTTPDISCMFFLNDYKCIISLVIMNEMQHSVFLLCLLARQDMRYLMYSCMDVDIEKKISFFFKKDIIIYMSFILSNLFAHT